MNVTVGCDLELECYSEMNTKENTRGYGDSFGFVRADTVLLGKELPHPELYDSWDDKKADMYLSAEQKLERLLTTSIGLDGNPEKLELRPKFSFYPETVIDNLKELVMKFHNEHPEVTLECYGHYVSLGGHIHFGGKEWKGKDISWEQLRIIGLLLDSAAGYRLLHSCGSIIRCKSKYYKPSELRIKPWGFEYRTPPAWLFRKPKYALLIMVLFQRIVDDYFSHPEKYDELTTSAIEVVGLEFRNTLTYKEKILLEEVFFGDGDSGSFLRNWLKKTK